MQQQNSKSLLMLSLIALLFGTSLSAQNKRIQIINSNSIEFDEKIGKDIKRLIGNVQFKHEDALMFCDSAYLNTVTNNLEAFSNVHIIQNDSIDLYGDVLFYNGNTKFAKVRQNVRLVHDNSVLTTDSLDYDRNTNIAHYFSWGYLTDSENNLQSVNGYYYTDDKDYFAIDSVTLVNPDYTIYSDSLQYNTGTEVAFFYGPTDIVSDSNFIYCEKGWYDTQANFSKLSQNAYIISKDKRLNADSIFYDRVKNIGEAFSNVAINDTSARVLITGNYANYFENTETAFVTDQALMTKYGGGDSLFLHADTLKMYTAYDTIWHEQIISYDSLLQDSLSLIESIELIEDSIKPNDTIISFTIDTFKIITAFHKAQIFKKDLQTRSDSLSYSTQDSIIKLYGNPIIWSDNQQISADYIELLTENNNPTEMFLKNSAFIALKDDSIRYNQIEGVTMRAYFDENNELDRLLVINKAKSVFFPREEATEAEKRDSVKGALVGANITESSKMMIWFKDNQPHKITLYANPKGVLNPTEYKPIEELMLKGFSWRDDLRPKNLEDIFIWKPFELSIEPEENKVEK